MENACRAFILNKGKILLCRQEFPPRNFWTLPGGSVEEGETLTDCISREIFEEIGITLEIDRMLYIRELIDLSRHRVEFYFSTKDPIDNGVFDRINPCSEVGEIRFFSIDDLRSTNVKPECLINLIQEITDGTRAFPVYLGNVS